MKIQRLKELHLVKKEIETHMSLIKILPPSKTDRHWVIPKGNKHLGWLPHTSQYVPIYATKPIKKICTAGLMFGLVGFKSRF